MAVGVNLHLGACRCRPPALAAVFNLGGEATKPTTAGRRVEPTSTSIAQTLGRQDLEVFILGVKVEEAVRLFKPVCSKGGAVF